MSGELVVQAIDCGLDVGRRADLREWCASSLMSGAIVSFVGHQEVCLGDGSSKERLWGLPNVIQLQL